MQQRELFSEKPAEEILSVWELTHQIKMLLEDSFSAVSVEGEMSDLARPQSGHCYFTLKDDRAQIRAVVWRNTLNRVRFDLHDGLAVVCRGHLDLYAPRGSYQLIVDSLEPQGIGALELAFRQLHEKLAKEGLFRPERKRPLPRFARRIAVVTSPTGAAIRDFLQVFSRRWRGTDVLIIPARVQGAGSVEEVVAGIEMANRLQPAVDCLVVTRGGGSLEDLWTFNEERVVRAIYASQVPVVSAIGHEIDVTLADLVADVRALTPSEAAELIAPAADEVLGVLAQYGKRLKTSLCNRAESARSQLDAFARHAVFRRPFDPIHDRARQLDELDSRVRRAMENRLHTTRQKMATVTAQLESLSPLAVLGRGYSLTQRTHDGRLIRSAADLAPGDLITTRFASGQTISRVEEVEM